MVVDPTNPIVLILGPLSTITKGNKKKYITNVRVMIYLLQAIPNDIYNSVDTSKNAKEMWEQIKRLMHGSEIATHVRHSHLMDEFDKFPAKEGESLDSVHERLTTLVNIMDRNNVHPIHMAINTKFLNCLQPKWSKYVTMNVGYDGNANKNAGRNITQGFNTGNAGDESNQIIQHVPQTESTSGKANVQCYNCNEKAMKDEAGSKLSNEENEFMLDTSYGEELEELTTTVMLMDRIQPANKNAETVPSFDAMTVIQCKLLAVGSPFYWQWEYPPLAVGTYTASGNSLLAHVRTDNGIEFKNKTLAKFFDEVGITQQFSAARTPQQNGVVERRNRTLVEDARTMLTFANLPSFL
uniref:Putative ribonuclease H-like domain-containing protein n=1 Tax=Tanacetum cinerariifolium TaxID=118510 RepID=A0A699IIW9_TANCI|nr:putative ribonuclease H-like domain-containing protein [Tanacetum cinerariifolium]